MGPAAKRRPPLLAATTTPTSTPVRLTARSTSTARDLLLRELRAEFDLFGDGSIRIAFTPGNTPAIALVSRGYATGNFVIRRRDLHVRQLEGGDPPRAGRRAQWQRSFRELHSSPAPNRSGDRSRATTARRERLETRKRLGVRRLAVGHRLITPARLRVRARRTSREPGRRSRPRLDVLAGRLSDDLREERPRMDGPFGK